jgi:uncharacterized protein (TIGR03083 family)
MNDEIIARIDAAWISFLPLLDGLTPEQASEPGACGYYSVNDVLAHLAWWEDQTRRVVESGRDEPIDVESLNDEIYEENKDASFDELRQRLIEGHARARDTFAGHPGLTAEDVKDDTWEHWEEHGEQIRAWRSSKQI